VKNALFALFLLFAATATAQTKSLGVQVVFVFEGDTMDTRFLEPYLIANGYEPMKAWATKTVFLEKCKAEGSETAIETIDAMIRERCGRGLKDYFHFYQQITQ